MNLVALGKNVFIRPDALPDQTADGLLHIVHDRKHVTMMGTVVAVGDGPEFIREVVEALGHDPEPFGNLVGPGDRVIFSPESGEELIFEKDLLICMKEDDILAVIE